MAKKWVYLFGEGNKEMADLLGGKGAGLAEMTKAGLPVPPGFTITTEACNAYFANGKAFPEGMWEEVLNAIKALEKQTGKKLGSPVNPLLVSCRSGARVSMPGMMDTVLNIGFNPKVLEGFAKLVGTERVAWDAYRRLIQMFGNIVKGIERHRFEVILDAYKVRTKGGKDTDLTVPMLKDVVKEFKVLYKQELKEDFPDDPYAQLREAVAAVFNSWFGPPAIAYRRAENLADNWGTAVNIQTMVFGNMGDNSGTGVAFTRNPATGEKQVWGEYLINAQGEDVVAGIRTPQPIAAMGKELPEAYEEFIRICDRLERHYRDMQDLEFTIERGKLWMLQTRAAKRTAVASVKAAVDMVKEGLITKEDALVRVTPAQVEKFLHPGFDPAAIQQAREQGKILAWGLNASPGAASGIAIFDATTAERRGKAGEKVILVRPDTNPDDVHGLIAAQGVLTQHGGMTCVAGDTRVLTDWGFLKAEEAYEQIAHGVPLGILAFDCSSGRSVWRRVIAAGRRQADVCRITVSQTGRAEGNTVRLTPGHKMMTVENRQLKKKELSSCLRDQDLLCILTQIPAIKDSLPRQADLAYCAGAIFTDGYVKLGPTKGSVTFSQKRVPGKLPFISALNSSFQSAFGVPFTYARHRSGRAVLGDRVISGSVQDLICFRREPARVLKATWDGIVPWVLSLDRESLLQFLAGVVDGDGTYDQNSNRINIFINKEPLLQAVVTACFRLGLIPQVTRNRGIHNVQITANFGPLLERTRRARGSERRRLYSHRLFSVRALFGDVANLVNPKGRVRDAVKRNVMFGADKIKRDILPLCPPSIAASLNALLKSEIGMYRMRQVGGLEPAAVYNFEVNAQDERDKNFIIFTKQYTPVLVSNSHAAVVARGWGKAAVVGCESIKINMANRTFRTADKLVHEGDAISIDGTTGAVFEGAIATIEPRFEETSELGTLLRWADEVRRLGVRANADTPVDAARARSYGAKGIGLCRTERMFTEGGRRALVVKMIMAANTQERQAFLGELLPFQRQDFEGIFRVMNGYPVTIRLLDPPMHEFLPPREKLLEELYQVKFEVQCNPTPDQSKKLEKRLAELEAVLAVVQRLWETNPMMGLRGCRAGIMYEGLTEMQTRAIFEAACNVAKEGVQVTPEVMIPLVSHANELKIQRETLEKIAKDVMKEKGIQIPYKFGTMIETPRAAVTADVIAPYADFYSFGTNDLTQMTFGVSRDDAEGKFLRQYVARGILPDNPFETIDQDGVGLLMKIAVQKGRAGNAHIEIGGCGEHFGDPRSIEFSHRIGLDYVSCSSFRVPVARLAAAQAALTLEYGRK